MVPEISLQMLLIHEHLGGRVGQPVDLVQEHFELVLAELSVRWTSGLAGPVFALCMLTSDFPTMVHWPPLFPCRLSSRPDLCDHENGREAEHAALASAVMLLTVAEATR
jgi:hypothetical protein